MQSLKPNETHLPVQIIFARFARRILANRSIATELHEELNGPQIVSLIIVLASASTQIVTDQKHKIIVRFLQEFEGEIKENASNQPRGSMHLIYSLRIIVPHRFLHGATIARSTLSVFVLVQVQRLCWIGVRSMNDHISIGDGLHVLHHVRGSIEAGVIIGIGSRRRGRLAATAWCLLSSVPLTSQIEFIHIALPFVFAASRT